MKTTTFVLFLKGFGSFVIPYGTTLGTGLAAFNGWPGWWSFIGLQTASVVSGFSGLTSFLSKTYSEHLDEVNLANGKPITETTVTK